MSELHDFASVLLRRKIITEAQLRGARSLQRQTNGRLQDVLVDFGYTTRDQVRVALAELDNRIVEEDDCPIDLSDVAIPEEIIELLPESVARDNQVIPIAIVEGTLHVAMADPTNTETLAKLQFILNRSIRPWRAPLEQIMELINRHYGPAGGARNNLVCEFTDTAIDFLETEKHPGDDGSVELESSEFELAIEESSSEAADTMVVRSGRTHFALDDAAREAMDGAVNLSMAAVGAAVPRAAKTLCYAAPAPLVERQATIRYYHRMSPERMFPLLVVISRKAILEVIKKDVAQKQSKQFHVELDSLVEVEPILPGCDCFPPKEFVRISAADATARFWVVPRVLGEVMHARVLVRQNGAVLAEVPLEISVVKQTLTLFVGALNFCVPFASMLLKQSQLSLSSAEGGAGIVAALAGWALLVLSPEVLAGLLLVATVGLYFWLRPRQRDVFWDIKPMA